jgi:PAS domain S-box-containing protein
MSEVEAAGKLLAELATLRAELAELDAENQRLKVERAANELAHQKFRVLFERSSDAQLFFDETGILDCNDAAVAMLRCADKTLLLSQHPAVWSPERQPDGRLSSEKSVEMDEYARKHGYHRFEWVHRRLTGEEFPVEVTLNPVTLSTGSGLLVAWHDLTEVRQREAALHEALATARAVSHAKSDFVVNVSHELRTPLNAIIGYGELLAEELDERRESDLLGVVARMNVASRHLFSLINNVLDLSKVEAGKMEVVREPVYIEDVIEDVITTLTPLAQERGSQLIRSGPALARPILSDATKIRQILFNLVGNAVKFTRMGTILVEVALRARDEQELSLCVAVEDSGIGMSEPQLSRVFEAFVQAEPSIASRFGGTGLGLTLCNRFAALLGGSIQATSTLGVGSRFVVELPVIYAVS